MDYKWLEIQQALSYGPMGIVVSLSTAFLCVSMKEYDISHYTFSFSSAYPITKEGESQYFNLISRHLASKRKSGDMLWIHTLLNVGNQGTHLEP